jgi:hypothetical protein
LKLKRLLARNVKTAPRKSQKPAMKHPISYANPSNRLLSLRHKPKQKKSSYLKKNQK